jgi:hypothetical protein
MLQRANWLLLSLCCLRGYYDGSMTRPWLAFSAPGMWLRQGWIARVLVAARPTVGAITLTNLGTVMLTGSQGQGDKEWEANVKAAVGFPLLIPPDRAHWPRYITAQDVHHHLGKLCAGEYASQEWVWE